MHKILVGAVALLAVLATSASAQAPKASSKALFPYPLKVDTLPNGLTVVRVPFNSPGLVAYTTVVRVGSRNEVEPGHTGFAHFFEHVMFKGTPKFPEGAREKLLGTLGFDDNAFTSDDVTVYHSVGPSSALPQLVEVEADRFRNLQFSEQTFQTEAKAVLGEYHKSAARPELKMEEALGATAFLAHPYQHTTLGFYDDIKKMPEYYEYSRKFFERWYTPDNSLLVIVGDLDDAKLMEQVKVHYGPWSGKAASVVIPAEPPQKAARSVHIDWPAPTLPRHLVAWHTPAASLKTADGAIQAILSAYLVGPTSPLYKELVLDKQLAESVGSGYSEHRDPHLFYFAATLKEESSRPAIAAAFDAAVKELASGKVDAKRLEDIKSNTRYGLLMSLETPKEVAIQLAWYAGILGAADGLERHLQNVSKVTAKQLVAFGKKYLVETNRTVLTLSPKITPAAAEKGAK